MTGKSATLRSETWPLPFGTWSQGWLTFPGKARWQYAWFVVLVILSYLAISRYIVTTVQVVGPSMQPTLREADQCLLNRWMYWFRNPERFDVVVLRDPVDGGYSVKRIIAIEGERVYLRDGHVYVNGRKLNEPFLPRYARTYPEPGRCEQLLLCGPGEYVVLGDNRDNSVDSRHYGVIKRHQILGCVLH